MKNLSFYFLIAIFLGNFCSAEEFNGLTSLKNSQMNDVTINGPAQLNNMRFKNLTTNGPLELKLLTVENEFETNGPVKGEDLKCNALKSTGLFAVDNVTCNKLIAVGPISGKNITINGDSNIIGPLSVKNSNFQNITIYSNIIRLDDTVIGSITVKKSDSNNHSKQELILEGATIINGDVIFESGNGKIKSNPKAKIVGKIQGALSAN
jgi:hypothetical protein